MLHLQADIQRGLNRFCFRSTPKRIFLLMASVVLGLMAIAPAAFAHHPLGGKAPSTLFEGFMSGVGHPVIGLDHFAFVIAVGLVTALNRQRLMIPLGFAVASLLGTGIHLQRLDLPNPEIFIAASVVLFGTLLAINSKLNTWIVAGLAIVAGVFHGYAYGEAIVGATITPLFAYLVGFTMIQLVIALIVCAIGQRILTQTQQMPEIPFRFAGFLICGLGAAFLSTALFG